MPLSLNEIKDRALAFSREWEGEKAERAEVLGVRERLLEGFSSHGCHILIPRKVIIIFIAVFDALFERSDNPEKDYSEASLKADINLILDALKIQGYLPTFSDYLLEFDKKRTINLLERIHDILHDGRLR